jgi:peptide/nickel transport system substrate-binding protein
MAIDRKALIARVLDGLAAPAAQAFPDGYQGSSPNLKPVAFDAAEARRLLAEAGYPRGFGATLHCPNKLFLRDRETCEAVASMLARVGVKLSIVLVPGSQFNTDRLKGEWPFYLQSAGTGMGEILPSFVAVAPTPDPARGLGPSNNQHYSNPEVDRLILAATRTMDDTTRWGMEARAMEIWVHDDVGVIATHRQLSIFATRKGLRLVPREDGMYTPHELTLE